MQRIFAQFSIFCVNVSSFNEAVLIFEILNEVVVAVRLHCQEVNNQNAMDF